MWRNYIFICFLLLFNRAFASDYIIYFKDKENFLLTNPAQFFSTRAIERRNLYKIPIEYTDYPVSTNYIQLIQRPGLEILAISKWLNAVYIRTKDEKIIEEISGISILSHIQKISSSTSQKASYSNRYPCLSYSLPQRDMLNLQPLHVNNFTGQDILICVLDDGFKNVNKIEAFSHLFESGRILGTHNFLIPEQEVYSTGGHGTTVLSNICGLLPGQLTGTAYGASFLLARTEIDSIESPLEMFLWAAGAEWADSAGADILSTSLGYTQFDNPADNYYYADMNGNTTVITRAAQIAAQKGLLVVNSAGNEGNNAWRYISAPGDAEDVITVGAVDSRKILASFSSRGPTWDYRLKPDLVCQGAGNVSVNSDGNLIYANGTSFSCPTFSGFAACILDASRKRPRNGSLININDLKKIIFNSCDRVNQTDYDYGRGIPDAISAFENVAGFRPDPVSNCEYLSFTGYYIYPVPALENIYVMMDNRQKDNEVYIQIRDLRGLLVYTNKIQLQQGLQQFRIDRNKIFASGIYYIQVLSDKNGMLYEGKITWY